MVISRMGRRNSDKIYWILLVVLDGQERPVADAP